MNLNQFNLTRNRQCRDELPPDVQFHEDVRLLVYRPRGSLNEASVNKIVRVIGELEARLKEPFNRFFDTLGHDEVDLNFRYVIQVSLYRHLSYQGRPPIKSAILATDSTIIHYGSACLADSRFADQGPHFPRSTGSGAVAQRADRTVNAGCRRNILSKSRQPEREIRDENQTRCS